MLDINSSMQLFFRLVPPTMLTAHLLIMVLVNHANQHANLVNTLGVTQCDAGSPLQTLSYALLHLFRYTFSQT